MGQALTAWEPRLSVIFVCDISLIPYNRAMHLDDLPDDVDNGTEAQEG